MLDGKGCGGCTKPSFHSTMNLSKHKPAPAATKYLGSHQRALGSQALANRSEAPEAPASGVFLALWGHRRGDMICRGFSPEAPAPGAWRCLKFSFEARLFRLQGFAEIVRCFQLQGELQNSSLPLSAGACGASRDLAALPGDSWRCHQEMF